MDIKAIQALRPFTVLTLDDSVNSDQMLDLIKKNEGRIFLLPRAPFLEPAKLSPFVQAGARLLIRKQDVIKQFILPPVRDSYISQFKHQVFLKGYSAFSSERFLKKGASILVDGQGISGAIPPEKIIALATKLSQKSQLKVSYHQFEQAKLESFLKKDIRLVFSCFQDMICDLELIKKCIEAGKSNVIISASNFAKDTLIEFLEKGACVVISGFDKIPFNVIRDIALAQDTVPDPNLRKLKVIPESDLANHLIELEQLAKDAKLALIEGDQWYFNNASTLVQA